MPSVPGLITVNAVHEPDEGDYESIIRVGDVTENGVVYTASGNIEDRRISVPVSMLVNDVRVDLPAVHGRGRLGHQTFELFSQLDPAAAAATQHKQR